MNKKILVVVCLLAMTTVFSGCGLLGGDKDREAAKEGVNTEEDQKNNGDKEESFSGSMKDLMARNESLKCTYEYVAKTGEASGVFYVSGNKARAEVKITEKETGAKVKIDSIIIGNWVYVQNSLAPWNLKINIKDLQDDVYDQDEVVNINEKMDFKCRSWIADDSKFVVPADLEFEEMTEALREHHRENSVEEVKNESKQGLCDVCRMYSDEAKKAKCLADNKCE